MTISLLQNIFPLLTCAKIIHSLRTGQYQYIKSNFQHHKALQGTNWHLPSPWHRCYSAWSRPRNPFSPWTFLRQQSSCEILTHRWVEPGGSWWQLPGTALGLPTEFSAWHWNWSVCVFLWGIPNLHFLKPSKQNVDVSKCSLEISWNKARWIGNMAWFKKSAMISSQYVFLLKNIQKLSPKLSEDLPWNPEISDS